MEIFRKTDNLNNNQVVSFIESTLQATFVNQTLDTFIYVGDCNGFFTHTGHRRINDVNQLDTQHIKLLVMTVFPITTVCKSINLFSY